MINYEETAAPARPWCCCTAAPMDLRMWDDQMPALTAGTG